MSCDYEPFVYTVAGAQEVDTGGAVSLGSIVHQANDTHACRQVFLDGDGIVCKGRGAFEADASIVLAPSDTSSTQTVSIELQQGGVAVPGSAKSALVGGNITLSVPVVVRNKTCTSSALTLVNTGAKAKVASVAMTVKAIR